MSHLTSHQTPHQASLAHKTRDSISRKRARLRRLATTGAAILGAAALTLGGAAAAQAHISVDSDNHGAGASTVLTFTVPHGCGISPTTEIAIQIPEGVGGVQPIRQPFYEVEAVWETLETPDVDGHGNEVTERITQVIYTANTPLPSDLRDTFEVAARLPADAAGETIYFPILQTCEEGDYAWIQIPADEQDPHDLEAPAPSLAVVEGGGDDHGHGHGDDADAPDSDEGASEGSGGSADAELSANESGSGSNDQTPLIITSLAVGGAGLIAAVIALFRGSKRAA